MPLKIWITWFNQYVRTVFLATICYKYHAHNDNLQGVLLDNLLEENAEGVDLVRLTHAAVPFNLDIDR